MVVSTPDWDFRRGFGSFAGSTASGSAVAWMREANTANAGSLQHIGRLVSLEVYGLRSAVFHFGHVAKGSAGSAANFVPLYPLTHFGTLASNRGHTERRSNIDNPLAEVPAGRRPLVRLASAVGTAPRISSFQVAFALFTKSGILGSVGPSST